MKLTQSEKENLEQIKKTANQIDNMDNPSNKDVQHEMDKLNTSIYHICMDNTKVIDRCGYYFADNGIADRDAIKALLPSNIDNANIPDSTRKFDKQVKKSLDKTKQYGSDWIDVNNNGSFNILSYDKLQSIAHKMPSELKKDIELSNKPLKLEKHNHNQFTKNIEFNANLDNSKPNKKQKQAMERNSQSIER